MIESIHDMYQKLTGDGSKPAVLTLLHQNGHRAALDEYLSKHHGEGLDVVLAGIDPVDAFLEIRRTADGMGCNILFVEHDSNDGKSRYIGLGPINDPVVLNRLNSALNTERLTLHVHGNDSDRLVRRMDYYLGTDKILELTGRHPFGVTYNLGEDFLSDIFMSNGDDFYINPISTLVSMTDDRYNNAREDGTREGDTRLIRGTKEVPLISPQAVQLLADTEMEREFTIKDSNKNILESVCRLFEKNQLRRRR